MKPQKTLKYAEILDRLASDNLGTTGVEALKKIVLASFSVSLRFQRQIIGGRKGVRRRRRAGKTKTCRRSGWDGSLLEPRQGPVTMFHKPEDDDAFEQILAEGRERETCRMLA
jgi:hypothetical protein